MCSRIKKAQIILMGVKDTNRQAWDDGKWSTLAGLSMEIENFDYVWDTYLNPIEVARGWTYEFGKEIEFYVYTG